MGKVNVRSLKEKKKNGEKIVMLTAYDYTTARLVDEAGVDIILVGDSLSNVFQGNESTLPVTVEEMLYHTQVVAKASKNAMVVADMPFLSFQVSKEEAVKNAGRFLKEAGANAVKIEGGKHMKKTAKKLVEVGIPVMGHIGLTPQSVNTLGGYRLVGKAEREIKELVEGARALDEAGVFSIVLEMVPEEVAEYITGEVSVPTIGIGAGPLCDGQVLVVNDMLGMTQTNYKFVKKYVSLADEIKNAVGSFAKDIKNGDFPDKNHSFSLGKSKEILEKIIKNN